MHRPSIISNSLKHRIILFCSKCQAILQGHTSLVGQLQMRGNTLVTGGSDGSVRVWSLLTNLPIHRLAAHDNSVTSLQFDDARIVSGGSDGRVKIWDTNTGALIRELSQPAEAVWRVAFESERCVVMASRTGRTIMEVWDFTPPVDIQEAGVPIDIGMIGGQEGDEEMLDAEEVDGKDTMLEAYGTGGSEEDSEDMTD
jgi:WD40 repeat protein